MEGVEYVIATNRVKVSMALHAMRDTISGDNFGVSDHERTAIVATLYRIEDRLFKIMDEWTTKTPAKK